MLAVLHALRDRSSDLEVCFVTDAKFGAQAEAILSHAGMPVRVKKIHAGKFRRYHKISMWRQLTDIPTVLRNIGDVFKTVAGFFQSLWLVARFKPDVVFTKGGFVCVPLGMAAKVFGVPLVIHDSDAHPGLANRILSRWARAIATGSPVQYYPYPKEITHYVGIPVDASFTPVDSKRQQELKAKLGFHDISKPLIVVTGGGLGAQTINQAIATIAPQLVERATIFHITGTGAYDEVTRHAPEHINYEIVPFISTGMAPVMGAADIVVSRVGATAMQELAMLEKPVVMVPNPYLTSGHQLKNAEVYQEAHAALTVDEEELKKNPLVLLHAIETLLESPEKAHAMGRALGAFAKPHAAADTAALILEQSHVK